MTVLDKTSILVKLFVSLAIIVYVLLEFNKLHAEPIDISILDSKDDPAVVYVIANDCKVKVIKSKLENICYLMKIISDTCHIDFDLKGCERAEK